MSNITFTSTVYVGDNAYECEIDNEGYLIGCQVNGDDFEPEGLLVVHGQLFNQITSTLRERLIELMNIELQEYGGWDKLERDMYGESKCDDMREDRE